MAPRHEFGSGRCSFGLKGGVNLRDFAGGSFYVEELAGHFVACDGEAFGFRAVLQ